MASSRTDAPVLYNRDYERVPKDLYETEEWITEIISRRLKLPPFDWQDGDTIWEPACGTGKMSNVLIEHFGYENVSSTDVLDYGYAKQDWTVDFLLSKEPLGKLIVTNPPFSLAEEFVRHALRLTEINNGIVCMLLRQDWDAAKTRNDLFTSYPFCRKITLTSRPRWFPYKKGDASPQHSYAWYCWLHGYESQPEIEYGHKPKGEK